MCATCARFSTGLTGTCTTPARAAASGSRHASRDLGSQLATRSPLPKRASTAAIAPTAASASAKVITPARSTSAGASGCPRNR